jgi:serine/threonine-protein kinase SRPK3
VGLCNILCSQLVMTIFRWPWRSNRYAALKITNCSEGDWKSATDELEISQHISKTQSKHEGRSYIRLIEDSFTIPGPFGEHLVMVFEPLREPLWRLGRHLGTVGLSPTILKAFLKLVLQGLDFLHSECHVIHTGKCMITNTLN